MPARNEKNDLRDEQHEGMGSDYDAPLVAALGALIFYD
jgi:hypothetical protein